MEISAEDLRMAIARRVPRLPMYVVAARARIHPVTLSGILYERLPLKPAMAERILLAIGRERAQ